MSAKHTPAPWILRDVSAHRSGTVGTAYGYAICDMADSYSSLDHDELGANARLIAAAPELLEALRELIVHRDELNLSDYPAITRARAAIAKATGEKA